MTDTPKPLSPEGESRLSKEEIDSTLASVGLDPDIELARTMAALDDVAARQRAADDIRATPLEHLPAQSRMLAIRALRSGAPGDPMHPPMIESIRPPGAVEVTCEKCPWSHWVECLDPRLPDGPWYTSCPACGGTGDVQLKHRPLTPGPDTGGE